MRPSEEKRWNNKYPETGTGPVPVEPYTSQEYFELERKHIFQRVWLHVGRVEEIPRTGDFLVKDLEICNTSILIVRGKDGVIRGFHNVCTHRCNMLVWSKQGSNRAFNCKFHGWTFDLQGKLTGVPDEDQFFDLKKSEHSLPPISVATWEGFIFINLDPNPKESLVEYLGVRGEELQGYPFNKLLSCHSWHAEIKCNWKMAVDAFQEAYHVSFVHKHSISDAFKVQGNSLAHPLTLKLYNHHHMLSLGSDPQSVYGNPLLKYEEKTEAVGTPQKKPIEAAALRFAASSTGGTEFSIDRLPAGVNPTKNPNWNGDITVFFPNLFTFMRVNYYQAYNFWPLAVDRTRFEGRVYYAQAENAGERFYEEYRKIMLRDVLLEDWSTVERSQAVMASGVRTHMVLQDNEILLRNFRRVLESYGGKDYTGNGISLCDEGGLSHVR